MHIYKDMNVFLKKFQFFRAFFPHNSTNFQLNSTKLTEKMTTNKVSIVLKLEVNTLNIEGDMSIYRKCILTAHARKIEYVSLHNLVYNYTG